MTFRLSLSVGSVNIPRVSNEPWRAVGVMSRLGGLLREDPDTDLTSFSGTSSKWPSLAARLFVACPVLVGEMVCSALGFFLLTLDGLSGAAGINEFDSFASLGGFGRDGVLLR